MLITRFIISERSTADGRDKISKCRGSHEIKSRTVATVKQSRTMDMVSAACCMRRERTEDRTESGCASSA